MSHRVLHNRIASLLLIIIAITIIGEGYMEIDVHIGSSAIADNIVGLCRSYSSTFICNLGNPDHDCYCCCCRFTIKAFCPLVYVLMILHDYDDV